ncbi:DoxX family membrane protein [Demequina sp. NBRC 110053]|uniref:DoxX family membrane protein n=1 Tax=Demequina sp. NBRC 110053 TaxID=1570342 RepID=UPI00190E97C0|nr:DoxX family membrane protein [Demequina sp. NBRC 110053]
MATTEPTRTTAVERPAGSRAGWILLSLARIAVGWIFLWTFLDKTFGLGFSTCRDTESGAVDVGCDATWASGARMTEGYLGSSSGPLADFYAGLGEQAWTDWPYMIGLLGIGLALVLGIGTRVAMWAAALMLAMMYTSHAWPGAVYPQQNPFVDEHIVYILVVFAAVLLEVRYQAIGLGEWWKRLGAVQKNRWLI